MQQMEQRAEHAARQGAGGTDLFLLPGCCAEFFAPLLTLPNVHASVAGTVPAEPEPLPLWHFQCPAQPCPDALPIGIFAAIHGDEPAGALAASQFLRKLSARPELTANFCIHVYPICNPSGFERRTRESATGKDLNREFWRNSREPEVQILEAELKSRHFQGLVQLHADDTSDGIYGFVRGHTLTEALLRPALRAAGTILERNRNATIDGFAARDSIIFDQYQGILAAPPEVNPVPFEIVLETPHHAPLHLQVAALELALETILSEYRNVVAYAANL